VIDLHALADVLKEERPTLRGTIMRILRRVGQEGYEGEIILVISGGGVRSLTWKQTETGATLKEDLG
jgi:hypothetical protein